MASQPNPKMREAGHKLRSLREARQMIQRDVEEETRRRFGETGTVLVPQISRIEKGNFDRVSIDDAVHIGAVLGLTPNQVATLYGLWDEGVTQSKDPPEIQEARMLAMGLPEDLRRDLLSWIAFASMQARAKARERLGEDAGTDAAQSHRRVATR